MVWTIVVILVLLGLLGLVSRYLMGGAQPSCFASPEPKTSASSRSTAAPRSRAPASTAASFQRSGRSG